MAKGNVGDLVSVGVSGVKARVLARVTETKKAIRREAQGTTST